jgi:CheY-like chemotaxis protein
LLGTGVELRTEFAPAVPPAAVAPGYAEQVLMNLVVNARDAMPHGGTVTVATAAARVMPDDPEHPGVAPGAYAVLRVTDTGCGMDEATQARMFEPFFTTKPPGAGTGLGLSTLRDIVHQARGHVRVHSARGRGTTFWVYLPVAAEACPAAPAAGPGPAGRGTETVLVIDADPAVRALMTHALRAHGYTVLSARDVCEGEARVRDHTGGLDAVVCDVPLAPAADQLTVRLRTRWPNLAVLFVSAAPGAEQFTSTAPEVPFLAKPFTPAALARSVRVLLDRR